MAYQYDKLTGDIIINGFENGIASSPYDGIADLKNVNITSIPHEASVNFATSQISPPTIPVGTVSSASGGVITYTGAAGLENYMCISFSATTMGNVSTNTPYWVASVGGGTFTMYSDYGQTSAVNATNGTGTFNVITVAVNYATGTGGHPRFFTYDAPDSAYFMLTSTGDLWSNIKVTGTNSYWTYCGLSGTTDGANQGAGLAYYQSYDGSNSFVFVFRNQTVDYLIIQYGGVLTLGWKYGWNYISGSASNSLSSLITASAALQTSTPIHNALVSYNDIVYFCDGIFIDSFYEVLPTTGIGNAPIAPYDSGTAYVVGNNVTYNNKYYTNISDSTGIVPTNASYWSPVAFDPSNPDTYAYVVQPLLPSNDFSQCIAFLGTTLMIGGRNNFVYVWDTTSPSFNNVIPLAEYNVTQLVSVNTNLYIFVGNRGRIYITNGSQAQEFRKIPDYLSGTIEPYFAWGGACSFKNQLYFSFNVVTNAGGSNTNYGGLWAISLDNNVYGVDTNRSLRMVNTLSYQTTTYQGYITAMIQNFGTDPAGTGLFIGWSNAGTPLAGIDTTTSAPYAGGTTVANGIINSDLIPIGTFLKPTTNGRVEFKLSVPIVNGESVQLLYRQKFSDSFTAITNGTFNYAGIGTLWTGYSGVVQSVNFEQSQWIQLQAILTSTVSSPSYTRLTELRLGTN